MKEDLAELDQLACAYLEGAMSDDQARRLKGLLTREENLRRFVQLLDLHVGLIEGGHTAGEVIAFLDQPPRRSRWMFWAPLAAAASVVLVAGYFALVRPGKGPATVASTDFARIMKQVGQVHVAGNRFSTGPASRCRLRYNDGSILALGENTRVQLGVDSVTGGITVSHETGQTYLDLAKQKAPLVVFSDGMRIKVVGTTFLVGRDQNTPYVDVFDGTVKCECRGSAVYLNKGQRGAPIDRGSDVVTFRLTRVAQRKEDLRWLEDLGIGVEKVLAASRAEITGSNGALTGGIDDCRVIGSYSAWCVEMTPQGIAGRQENAAAQLTRIWFEHPRFKRFEISFRFRIRGQSERRTPDVGFVYGVDDGLSMLCGLSSSWLEKSRKDAQGETRPSRNRAEPAVLTDRGTASAPSTGLLQPDPSQLKDFFGGQTQAWVKASVKFDMKDKSLVANMVFRREDDPSRWTGVEFQPQMGIVSPIFKDPSELRLWGIYVDACSIDFTDLKITGDR